jgi:ABC-type spermidine/putrescine transport system permease subunit II
MTASVLAPSVGRWRAGLVAVSAVLAVFLLVPGLMILVASLSSGQFLEFPPDGLSLHWYGELLRDPTWRGALWTSVRIAAAGALVATLTGTAAALGLRRVRTRSRALRSAFIAPIALPYIVYVLGLYNLFDGLDVLGASWPIVLGQSVLAFPIVFVTVDALLAGLDPRIPDAAASLGAPWPMVVARVELPLALPAVAGSAAFAFSFCFDEVVIALFLSGPGTVTFPVKIFSAAQDSVSPVVAAASTTVTIAVLLLAGVFAACVRRAARREAVA